MVIPVLTRMLGTVTKGLVREQEVLKIREGTETIQITDLLKSTR